MYVNWSRIHNPLKGCFSRSIASANCQRLKLSLHVQREGAEARASIFTMMYTRAHKRSAADSSTPLHEAGTLKRVLDYVGGGRWCFMAEVNSLWRDVYMKVAGKEIQMIGLHTRMTCIPQTTVFSSVFESPYRVRLAHAHELACTTTRYERATGMHADVYALGAAHELGMQYTRAVMLGAARCNELAVVQFLRAHGCALDTEVFDIAAARGHIYMCAYLHAENCPWDTSTCAAAVTNNRASTLRWLREHGCPWDASTIHIVAAQGGSLGTLVVLQQKGMVFTPAMLTEMLDRAGRCNKLAVAKWLRAQGAEWPAVLMWHPERAAAAIAWARAEGCTSPVAPL
jgi:hypothetical protein